MTSKDFVQRGSWSSRIAFIWAAAGAAVGLGNIWKFPYMTGEYGGAAFVLVYLLCVVAIGIPAMMTETVIGRLGKQNSVSSMRDVAIQSGASKHWQKVGWWGISGLFVVFSFYSVIAGFSLFYTMKAFSGAFTGLEPDAVVAQWTGLLANPGQILFWTTLFIIMTMFVVEKGVEGGLERANKIMMPALLILLILLVGYGVSTPGFSQAFSYMFAVDFSKITVHVVIAAMGQAFFSLAVGAGVLIVYGSYLPGKTRLGSTAATVVVLDILVALLAGLAIFPIVFSFGLMPDEGPGLMFVSLPIAFSQMTGGAILGGMFFLLLVFAAWTSSISMAEPIVAALRERYHFTRMKSSLLIGSLVWILSIGTVLSFNVWENVYLIGDLNFFALADRYVSDTVLPIGVLLFAIFAGWFISQDKLKDELGLQSKIMFNLWKIAVRYFVPIAIILVFISAWI